MLGAQLRNGWSMTPVSRARIDRDEVSVVIEKRPGGDPVWLHVGAPAGTAAQPELEGRRARATYSLDRDAPLAVLPVRGLGWFGPVAVELRTLGGASIAIAFDDGHVAEADQGIVVTCRDGVAGVQCAIKLHPVAGGAIVCTTVVENIGATPFAVERLASLVLPLPGNAETLLSWRGIHAAELQECREPMPRHAWVRETRRGMSGHGGPPGFYVLTDGATYDEGLVIALQLAWSGDSRLSIERDDEGSWIASAEARIEPGEVVLAPGERHEAPPLILAVSVQGRNGALAQQHAAVRQIMRWPDGAMAPRPVHLNSWEACYFAHDEARIGALATTAAALGVERLVLDDGWFAGRNDDRAALGDWTPDPIKYPRGLAALAHKVVALGMQFGLWVEPEMVSPDSELYRAHPDWALALPGRERPTGRHQLVLDMRRPEVRDHLFTALDQLLRDAPIGYLKWDHNRDLAPPGGRAQVAGTYELLARLRAAHPAIEIESCAGGGGRSDAGIARHVHRFWTSDNLDAVSRVAIQRGFAAFLPPETMGAHVGASPAHATGRRQSLAYRAAVACMGHFGLELDPARLSEQDRDELAGWIAFYKHWRGVIHGGHLRLGEGADGILWQAHGDGNQWLLFAIRTRPAQNRRPQPVRLPFARGASWQVRLLRLAGVNHWLGTQPWEVGEETLAIDLTGNWLAEVGLPLPQMAGEAVAIFQLGPRG